MATSDWRSGDPDQKYPISLPLFPDRNSPALGESGELESSPVVHDPLPAVLWDIARTAVTPFDLIPWAPILLLIPTLALGFGGGL